MKVCIEIHSGEGGQDSRLFVQDMALAYIKMFNRFG